jgi:hypothetical protein
MNVVEGSALSESHGGRVIDRCSGEDVHDLAVEVAADASRRSLTANRSDLRVEFGDVRAPGSVGDRFRGAGVFVRGARSSTAEQKRDGSQDRDGR